MIAYGQYKNIKLQHLEEAFTSEHWIVRIYKVKKPANRLVSPTLAAEQRAEIKKNAFKCTLERDVQV